MTPSKKQQELQYALRYIGLEVPSLGEDTLIFDIETLGGFVTACINAEVTAVLERLEKSPDTFIAYSKRDPDGTTVRVEERSAIYVSAIQDEKKKYSQNDTKH